MEKDNRSYNTQLTVMTRQFLVPSWPKIFLHLLVGALLLLLWNAKTIWTKFDNSILPPNSRGINIFPSHQTGFVEKTFDNIWGGRLAQILFWAFAGCAVYVCVWFAINIFTNVRNDIVADTYVHPRPYSRSNYWESVIARKVFLGMVLITLLGSIVMSLRAMPVLAGQFYSSVQNIGTASDIGKFIGSIIGAALIVYILVLLAHIAVNCWHAVYADL